MTQAKSTAATRAATRRPSKPARGKADVTPVAPPVVEEETSTSDAVIRDIVEGLFDGHYVPGQRLVETDLMQRFDVGRSTIREALKCLASDGIVKLERHRGAYIHNPSLAEVEETLRVIEVMMGLAGRLAAENIDEPGAAARLRQSFTKAIGVAKNQNLGEAMPIRNAFHQTIIEIGQNHQLLRLLPTMHVQLVRVRAAPVTDGETRARYYKNLAEAILAGDGDRADKVARTHIRDVRRKIAQLPATAFRKA